jgi:two-component system, OmpR family, phosphate regulon response regulator PhoB
VTTPKVLIADADEVYRRQLRDFLSEKDNFTIYDVGSGETALITALKNPPSVVLLEIALPDMSGIEVCRKLKSNDQLKLIPVIIHSVKIGLKDRLSAYVVGAHKYLAKPCKMDEIYECLQGALRPNDNQSGLIAMEMDRMRNMYSGGNTRYTPKGDDLI